MKNYFLVFLLIFANFQWVFILSNYDRIKTLQNISTQKKDVLKDEKYDEKLADSGYISYSPIISDLEEKTPLKTKINVSYLRIPSIDVFSPVFTTGNESEYDKLLSQWVINLNLEWERKWFYIFWHSSAEEKSDYQFIFTNITKLGTGDSVYLEWEDGEVLEYEYSDAYYKNPKKLSTIHDDKNKIYLITCYPFWSDISRYVVELKLKSIHTK